MHPTRSSRFPTTRSNNLYISSGSTISGMKAITRFPAPAIHPASVWALLPQGRTSTQVSARFKPQAVNVLAQGDENAVHWAYYKFNGKNKWNPENNEEQRKYMLNAYRVLLTRAAKA